jgi:hypothetical protein
MNSKLDTFDTVIKVLVPREVLLQDQPQVVTEDSKLDMQGALRSAFDKSIKDKFSPAEIKSRAEVAHLKSDQVVTEFANRPKVKKPSGAL